MFFTMAGGMVSAVASARQVDLLLACDASACYFDVGCLVRAPGQHFQQPATLAGCCCASLMFFVCCFLFWFAVSVVSACFCVSLFLPNAFCLFVCVCVCVALSCPWLLLSVRMFVCTFASFVCVSFFNFKLCVLFFVAVRFG